MTTNDKITAAALLADNLLTINTSATYAEKREMEHAILEENPTIERLTRGVMAALVACPWVDEAGLASNYSEVRGYVKDAIMAKIMHQDLQDLAQIEAASRNWKAAK